MGFSGKRVFLKFIKIIFLEEEAKNKLNNTERRSRINELKEN